MQKKQIRSIIWNYRHFNKKIITKYKRPDKIELFSFVDNDDYSWVLSEDPLKMKCDIFKWVVLPLSELDHNLSVKADHDTFIDLLFYLNKLDEASEIEGKPIKILLESKCKILLYKLAKRVEQDDKKYYYTHNLSDKEFDISDTIPNHFIDFINDIDLQYYDDFEKSDLKNRFLDYCKKIKDVDSNPILSLQESHALIKYYKDKNTNGERYLKLIYEKNIPSILESDHTFDQRAKCVSYHYLLNNYFSFLTQNTTSSNSIIKAELDKISERQPIDDVENYFPYFRYSENLINKLDAEFANVKIDSTIARDLLSHFDQNFKILMMKYEWCFDRDFLAYMPTYSECVKNENIEGQEYKLFIASSFVLPINYAQVKRKIDELYQKFTKYKLLLDVKDFQDKSNKKLDNKINKRTKEFDEIEERVKDSERKNIEILGIFAAIVLFTMSNIQIFSKIDYVKDAILFMLIMAYCMSLFIVVIWLITRDKGYFGKDDDYRAIINKTPSLHKFIIGILIAATVVSLIYTAPYFNSIKSDSRDKKFEKLQSGLDSINLKTDSIIHELSKKQNINSHIKKTK